jgi:glycosyltransferase involved in cell wall biosynthesis
VPAVYVEHNAPKGDVPWTRHPLADTEASVRGVVLVHVTHFNDLMWDAGSVDRVVIEHGVVDPGPRWTGEQARAAVVVNEPLRRGRVTGTDLLPAFAEVAPLDVFGMGVAGLPDVLRRSPERLRVFEDLPQAAMHTELARRRVYLHPVRWTSLGLSLLEAMHLAMPVVALATTEVTEAVPPEAGVVSTRVEELRTGLRRFLDDPDWARHVGKNARAAAVARYGLPRFLHDWDRLLQEVTR